MSKYLISLRVRLVVLRVLLEVVHDLLPHIVDALCDELKVYRGHHWLDARAGLTCTERIGSVCREVAWFLFDPPAFFVILVEEVIVCRFGVAVRVEHVGSEDAAVDILFLRQDGLEDLLLVLHFVAVEDSCLDIVLWSDFDSVQRPELRKFVDDDDLVELDLLTGVEGQI